MKSTCRRILLGITLALGGGIGFLAWNVAPGTMEKRMLMRTTTLLDSMDRGDRLAILRQTVTEQDVLEEMNEEEVIEALVCAGDDGDDWDDDDDDA